MTIEDFVLHSSDHFDEHFESPLLGNALYLVCQSLCFHVKVVCLCVCVCVCVKVYLFTSKAVPCMYTGNVYKKMYVCIQAMYT